uniref:Interleukin 20 n=1 Tax=Phocoena sinus TaxID=42100 RepID=A0A8C9CBW4_PHOSS
MKGSGLPLCLLSAVFYVFWTPSARLKTLHLGSCVITASLQAIRSGFSEIQDRVSGRKYESGESPSPLSLDTLHPPTRQLYLDRKISSLANSFLTIKKDLCLCHAHMTCPSGEEAMEKYSQLMSHFKELQPQAAVVKALGELDILLSWMEEMD